MNHWKHLLARIISWAGRTILSSGRFNCEKFPKLKLSLNNKIIQKHNMENVSRLKLWFKSGDKVEFPINLVFGCFSPFSLAFPSDQISSRVPLRPGADACPSWRPIRRHWRQWRCAGSCFESTSPKSRLTHVCELLVGARFLVFTLSLVAACLIRLRCLCDGITLSKSRKPAHTRIRHQKSPFLIQRSFTGRIGHTHPSFAPLLPALIFYLEKDDLI